MEPGSEPKTQWGYVRVAVVGETGGGKSAVVAALAGDLGGCPGKVSDGPDQPLPVVTKKTPDLGIKHHIIGFDGAGVTQTLPKTDGVKSERWVDLMTRSQKIVSLLDVPNSPEKLKSTIRGLTSLAPDYVMLVVAADAGMTLRARKILGIILAFQVPFLVVVTKTDSTPDAVKNSTLQKIREVLESSLVNKKVIFGSADGISVASGIPADEKNTKKVPQLPFNVAAETKLGAACPIFPVSATSKAGIPSLASFLGSLEPRVSEPVASTDSPGLAQVDLLRHYNIEGSGVVVVGLVKTGTPKIGQTLTLGPLKHNTSKQVTIRSIQFHYHPVETAFPGQICAFGIKAAKKKEELVLSDFRKGSVMVESPGVQKHSQGFQADISVLHHSTPIKTGFLSLMHCGVVSQAVQIVKMDKDCLRTGDVARATFRFVHCDEYLLPNSFFLLCDGSTRAPRVLGVISRVHTSKAELETLDLADGDKSPDT